MCRPSRRVAKRSMHAAILFSFGVVLYQMATGHLPFDGTTSAVIFHAILEKALLAPTEQNGSLPSALNALILKALEASANSMNRRIHPPRAHFVCVPGVRF